MNSGNVKRYVLSDWACATLFVGFALVYLYCCQADLLTVMQHIFSKGQTHYNHLVGAIIITSLLFLIQIGTDKLCRKLSLATALTYVPSMLCLTALTSAKLTPDGDMSFGGWGIALPLGMVSFALLVWAAYALELSASVISLLRGWCHSLWLNLLVMIGLMLFVCLLGNDNKAFRARIHAEQCLLDTDYDGALHTLRWYGQTDDNRTMLIAYALSNKGELANHLFEYQPKGGAEALMPNGHKITFLLYPEKKYYLYLGGWYKQLMQTKHYLAYQQKHRLLNRVSVDYLLCAYLLERNLDAFANNVANYYVINDSLPKHYKEALVLYQHKHSTPKVIYNNNVMDADFQDFQKLERQYADSRERQTKLRDTYGNTYWYYYKYK